MRKCSCVYDNSFDVNPKVKFPTRPKWTTDNVYYGYDQDTVCMRLMNYHTHIVYINIVLINTMYVHTPWQMVKIKLHV